MLRGEVATELPDAPDGGRVHERTAAVARFGMFALREPEQDAVCAEATRLINEVLDVELSSILENTPSGDRFL